jgi:hypothetical protein
MGFSCRLFAIRTKTATDNSTILTKTVRPKILKIWKMVEENLCTTSARWGTDQSSSLDVVLRKSVDG